ncbi:hypothetical protein RB195_007489 [Necator americanus]|uniref:Uncharacterized protein n=1 Tax=Necator americanus TaxID=51031 RepID=A0ABR1C0T7_NECAM
MSVVDPHHQRSQAASLPIRNSPHHDVRIGDLGSTIKWLWRGLTARNESCLDGYLATFGLGRPAGRLVQRVLKSLLGSSWKKPPGRKRKFWTDVVKEDLRTLGMDRQFRRDVRFRRTWNSDEWIDSVQALAEDREGWAELCSRTAHLGEDAGNRVRR